MIKCVQTPYPYIPAQNNSTRPHKPPLTIPTMSTYQFGVSSRQHMRTTKPAPNSTRAQRNTDCNVLPAAPKRGDRATHSQSTQHTLSLPGYATSPSAPERPEKDYEGSSGAPCKPEHDSSSKAHSSLWSRGELILF